jgi:hypothetical protein
VAHLPSESRHLSKLNLWIKNRDFFGALGNRRCSSFMEFEILLKNQGHF